MTQPPPRATEITPVPAVRALVAEDQAGYRAQITALLAALGVQADAAADGREALRLIELGTAYDLLVTDLQMPHYTGFEVTEAWLRARHDARRVIMVTGAAGSLTVRLRAAELGICLLVKADIGPHLAAEVRRVLRSST